MPPSPPPPLPAYRIGVDVGGTNTDAALLDVTAAASPGRGVLASFKAATTPDITSGIARAVRAVLAGGDNTAAETSSSASSAAAAVDRRRILSVTIGTTHFINALLEADAARLSRVAVVRLCGPFTRGLPPFADFPRGLRRVLDGGAHFLDGGLEIDGREIAAVDFGQVRDVVAAIRAAGVDAVALVGVFSPLDHDGRHEEAVRAAMLVTAAEAGFALDVVCSHHVGGPGLLERENATILNAAILKTARRTVAGFRRAMRDLELSCPLFLSQNDGTLIDADEAAAHPIKTF
ncbi:hypothetical protein HK405_008689, partial [Cladochytrium tenue]